MMNLAKELFFDHHTHLLDPKRINLTAKELSMNFLHGYQDMEPFVQGLDANYAYGRASERQKNSVENLGVVKTVVNHLSKYFDCEPTIESVLTVRNKHINNEDKFIKYTKELYEDQMIIGTVLDWPSAGDEKQLGIFPVPVYKLYNYEDVFFEQIKTAGSFKELINNLTGSIREAIAAGFAALKCHICEHYTMDVKTVSDSDAELLMQEARNGDAKALEGVYFAMFRHILLLCQELDVPIHIHVGSTGFNRRSASLVSKLDPLLMVPFLISDPIYVKTKIIFLHQAYPFTRHAALMAYSFPNIYVDTSWTLPWASAVFCSCIEDVLSTAPHNKIVFGSGQHGIPEIAWTAAKIAKTSLAHVLDKMIGLEIIAVSQAEETASMLLYKNAQNLYKTI